MTGLRPLLLLSVAALLPALLAMQPGEAATDVVRLTLKQARGVVAQQGDRNDRLDALRSLSRELFDTRAMGVRTLGDQLEARSADELEAFFDVFDDYVVRAYLQRLLFFREPRFGFAPPLALDDGILVRTRIITPKDEFFVDYRMSDGSGRWLATDIVVEGISLMSNFREQFASYLRTHSFEELLDLMGRKTRWLRERDAAK